ncbi:MAG: PadR family transcriptional regulator, partial [Actinomycetota bacterium]|nr:PadR family transcriptional regulator [Actinomycetota bacterium]
VPGEHGRSGTTEFGARGRLPSEHGRGEPGEHGRGEPGEHGRGEPGGPPWRGGPGGPGRGGRMRRGDIRPLLLTALLDGPAHGYEIIRRLDARSSGMWKPSPGSVYPTLQLLADAELVTSTESEGKRTYELTATGRSEAEGHRASGTPEPWDTDPSAKGRLALREAIGLLHHAARQVAEAGGTDEVAKATAIVHQARQSLYRILSET